MDTSGPLQPPVDNDHDTLRLQRIAKLHSRPRFRWGNATPGSAGWGWTISHDSCHMIFVDSLCELWHTMTIPTVDAHFWELILRHLSNVFFLTWPLAFWDGTIPSPYLYNSCYTCHVSPGWPFVSLRSHFQQQRPDPARKPHQQKQHLWE